MLKSRVLYSDASGCSGDLGEVMAWFVLKIWQVGSKYAVGT